MTLLTTANGYVQTTTDPALRGRVLAVYMAVIMGATPIGAPIAGWIVDAVSPRAAIAFGGIMAAVAFAIGTIWTLRSGRVHRAENSRFRLTLDETLPITVIAEREAIGDVSTITTPIRLTDPASAKPTDEQAERRDHDE